MGAMVPPSQWLPEDDVLLKSAVEAGASLESLAKGAVQFSRRYTVKELQNRWYSLLYDSMVVAEAAPLMFEVARSRPLDQPRPNKSEAMKETALTSGKRKKTESIRKCYYALRKRICNEPLDIMGADLLQGPSAPNFRDGNVLGVQGPNLDVGPYPLPEFGPQFPNDLPFGGPAVVHDLPFTYDDSTLTRDGAHDGILGFDQPDLFGPEAHLLGLGFRACESELFRDFTCSSSTMSQMPMWDESISPDMCVPPSLSIGIRESDRQTAGDDFAIPPSCDVNMTHTYLAELSNTLFSDDLLSLDSCPKDDIDTSYFKGLSSLLMLDTTNAQLLDGTSGEPHLQNEYANKDPSPQATIRVGKEFGPEYKNGVICCMLNTEDPEIPSNEDVFLPFRVPSPTDSSSGVHWKVDDTGYTVPQLPSPCIKDPQTVARKAKVEVGPTVTRNNSQKGPPCGPSRLAVMTGLLEKGSKCSVLDKVVKFELPKSDIQQAALKNARNGEGYSCRSSLGNESGYFEVDGVDFEPVGICLDNREHGSDVLESLQRKNDIVKAEILNVGLASGELSCQKTIDMPPVDESQVLDMDEWSENDVPCFSDVEAMILNMNLSPTEPYLFTNPEVRRYMHEESKRAIMRLEQGAEACINRAIASHGSFAFLYGHWSKYFIKKPEVIIGRATEDNKVDIDLGREKNGGKISRKQAIIKMDMHGTFELINIGKSWVHVNDKDVLPGQSLRLVSGCLIEVRGLAFIFETSRMSINQYLNSI